MGNQILPELNELQTQLHSLYLKEAIFFFVELHFCHMSASLTRISEYFVTLCLRSSLLGELS